ncbi:hypothetical protein [Motilibacter deserti]|uniref:Glycosyl transferase family 2 n=1 Tax=Motilibacter deserti TaxID=2714956 RepID=A0ABX0GUK8_9ACTN|nr:hypothetical protein [Motilibacter deserti]NHC13425.1 hypothetical protein [Motilibacter deserti]
MRMPSRGEPLEGSVVSRVSGAVEHRVLRALPHGRSAAGTGLPSSLGVVLVGWDEERTARCVRILDRWLGTAARGRPVAAVLVDNSGALSERTRVAFPGPSLRGSNDNGEFSGFDEGIAFLRQCGNVADAWLLLNDRFASYDDSYFQRFAAGAVDLAVRHSLAVGRLEPFPRPVRLAGQLRDWYIRTTFVLLPDVLLQAVGGSVSLVSATEWEGMVGSALPGPGQRPHITGVDPEWTAQVFDYLTDLSTDPAHRWYRAAAPTAANWPELRAKMRSIYLEHLLSARLSAAGADLTELLLASFAASAGPGRVQDEILAMRSSAPSAAAVRRSGSVRLRTLARVLGAGLRR